jgi:Zn-dependent alcohol dehydrogenase
LSKLRVDPNQLVTAMVAWLGAGVTTAFGAAVNAAVGSGDTVA